MARSRASAAESRTARDARCDSLSWIPGYGCHKVAAAQPSPARSRSRLPRIGGGGYRMRSAGHADLCIAREFLADRLVMAESGVVSPSLPASARKIVSLVVTLAARFVEP